MKQENIKLLKLGFVALPIVATIGGALAGYALSVSEMDFESVKLGKNIVRDVIMCGALGFLGGITLSCFGHVALHYVKVGNAAKHTKHEGRKYVAGAPGEAAKTTMFYTKQDVKDNEKSTMKAAEKHKAKAAEDAVITSKILEKGTTGLEEERRQKLGLPPISQSGIKKPSGGKNSTPDKKK